MITKSETVKVLVVDVDSQVVSRLGAELRKRGYEPLEATSYEDGKDLLIRQRPSMLITDIRLRHFNGLQLLIRGRAERPELKAVITCAFADAVLEAETRRFGGTFMLKSAAVEEIVATVLGEKKSAEKPAPGFHGIERRITERRRDYDVGFVPDRRLGDRRGIRR